MSEKHTRAVQRLRRNFTDHLDYEILCIIALDTGRDGSPAKTSYRGMAERSNCHYNTAMAHVEILEKAGLISVERDGKYNAYRLLVDCDSETEIITSGYDNQAKIITSDCDNYQELSQRLSQLEQTLSQRLSQLEARIVTVSQTVAVTEDSKDISEEKREEKKTPPSPRRTTSPLSDSPADQRVAAICAVCGLDANVPAHRTQAENAAAQLSSYKSDLIVTRYTNQNGHSPPGWNWFRDDWRGRGGEQPTPAQVVETISKKRERVAAAGAKDKPEIIDPTMPKPGQGGVW